MENLVVDLFSLPGDATDYRCPTMDTFQFPDLHGPITIDTETHDPHLKTRGSGWAYDRYDKDGGKVLGISVHTDNFHEYLPIGHSEGNMDPVKVKAWLDQQCTKDEKQEKIFANAPYDVGWLKVEGVNITGKLEDVQYQAPLIDENRFNYSLDALAKEYLGVGKDETLLLEAGKAMGVKNTKKDNVKGHLMRIHPNIVGVYANQDTFITRGLWDKFNGDVDEQGLHDVYRLEMDLVPMHIEMRLRGIRVDVERAESYQRMFVAREKEAKRFIKDQTGIEIGSWDTAAELAKVFDVLGIKYGLTEKSKQPSITADFLKMLKHPIADAMLLGRRVNNMNNTFIQNAFLNMQQRGRVYPNFNQLKQDSQDGGAVGKETKAGTKGAVSGRYSSSNPNFQQIPTPEKDDPNADYQIGHMIRSLIIPEEGEYWHGLDYSSQEPRGIVHFAELTNCRQAAVIAERYREDPDTDFHLENAKLLISKKPDFYDGDPKKARKPVKTIGLGIAYGMGGGKLCFQLGLPYTEAIWMKGDEEIKFLKAGPEGVELMMAFDEATPYIKELAEQCKNRVKQKGFIRTPLGRRFHFPKDASGRYMWLNKALNRLIQGTSADMTKLAMRNLYREGILPHGTVHDEIDFSSADPKVVMRAKEIMETSLKMTIPIRVDVGSGVNWGDSSVPKLGADNWNAFMTTGKMAA
jgi:DNA polymerase I-like protein with 3'-5' exonuclease and polymerase domains